MASTKFISIPISSACFTTKIWQECAGFIVPHPELRPALLSQSGRLVSRASRDTPSCFSARPPKKRAMAPALPNKKAQRAKHTSGPISPAPGTLLSTALLSGSPQLYLNFIVAQGTRLPRHPKIKEIMNSTRNITNRSFAMPADAAAIPPNPKTAATSAMIRNITAQPNISSPPPE